MKKPRFTLREMLSVIWNHGDRVSRIIATYALVGYVLPALPFVWLVLKFPREVNWAFGLVWLTGPLYLFGFNAGVFNAEIYREGVRRGWGKPTDDEYYLQLAEYLDRYGKNGRNRGDIAVTIGFWVLWYGTMTLSVLFSVAFIPIFHELTPGVFFLGVNIPVIVLALYGAKSRTTRSLRLATTRGYRLEELFPGGRSNSKRS
jgi:hypothetical protein